ncbi:hypothetical protein [Frisingicoccus sp.]|uniref:hypothetical protein n=1 Tax=Frisingicoccus sp. TaxID=1918627 RepID=UPI002A8288BC|nr:hypothetical protein [Frisingicoccus sp.]MDY4923456.1 hypothetical protein [Frisingicoccus sp.]
MRKIIAILIGVIMLFCCIGCGESKDTVTEETTKVEATTEPTEDLQDIAFGIYTYSVPKDAKVENNTDTEDILNYGTRSVFDDYIVQSYYVSGCPDTVEESVESLYQNEYVFAEKKIGNGITGLIATSNEEDVDGRRMYAERFCTVSDNVFYEIDIWSYDEDMSEVEKIVFDSLR